MLIANVIKGYSKPYQKSKMELFAKIFINSDQVTIAKSSIFDNLQGSGHASKFINTCVSQILFW